jgi:hypothetical protein
VSPEFASGALTAAFSRAFNDEAHRGSESLSDDELDRAVSRVTLKINEARAQHPERAVQLERSDFDAVMESTYRNVVKADYKRMGYLRFRWNMRVTDGFWFGYPDTVFEIGGIAGRHLGADLNYSLQGMAWASVGAGIGEVNAAVHVWNYGQGLTGQGLRNFRQPPYSMRWATYGHQYFTSRAGGSNG